MSRVAVVTDSTAGIPSSLLERLPIFVIPLHLIWKDKVYLDSVDIHPIEFYQKLAVAKELPTTSQPSPQTFLNLYSRLLDEGHDIISIHISSKLSGTIDSAIQAKNSLHADGRIEVIDSLSSGMELGFHVLEVDKASRNGANLVECKKTVLNVQKKTGIYFMVNTLEFLHKGGRIGGAAAFLGTALNLKPILELRQGKIEAVDKIRTQSKALDRLLELVEISAKGKQIRYASILHSNAESIAQSFLEKASDRFSVKGEENIFLSDVSPVIGAHVGPGCIAIAFQTE